MPEVLQFNSQCSALGPENEPLASVTAVCQTVLSWKSSSSTSKKAKTQQEVAGAKLAGQMKASSREAAERSSMAQAPYQITHYRVFTHTIIHVHTLMHTRDVTL